MEVGIASLSSWTPSLLWFVFLREEGEERLPSEYFRGISNSRSAKSVHLGVCPGSGTAITSPSLNNVKTDLFLRVSEKELKQELSFASRGKSLEFHGGIPWWNSSFSHHFSGNFISFHSFLLAEQGVPRAPAECPWLWLITPRGNWINYP